jgi:hypothetical protein
MAAGEEKRNNKPFFSLTSGMVGNFFQLHKYLELVEYPLRYSKKTAGVGCVWLKNFGVELVFLDLELCGALQNTPLFSTSW